jgi:hypothetical protein
MGERSPALFRCGWKLSLLCVGVSIGLIQFAGVPPSGGSTTLTTSSRPTANAASAGSTAALTLDQWKQRYEHDVGIMADDVLVVVDDGKRAQHHDTKAKVKTTLNDCRTWASDAGQARTAAPPIPMASAESAWKSMIRASAHAASDCLAALQHGSRRSAKDFQKQLKIVEQDEVTLNHELNGS